jgi:hypothetical protein
MMKALIVALMMVAGVAHAVTDADVAASEARLNETIKRFDQVHAFNQALGVTSSLQSLGSVFSDSKFRYNAQEIMASGPYKIFQNINEYGTSTIVVGSGKAVIRAVNNGGPFGGMGAFDVTSIWDNEIEPGVYKKSALLSSSVFDSNTGFMGNHGVFSDSMFRYTLIGYGGY